MDIDQESTVETVIELTPAVKSLPQSYPFKESKFYVRECYEEYYEYIDDALKNGILITTLTGTPGIGKSVFYMYFFQRYRKENPDKTIVTASFSKERELEKCVVFRPGQAGGETSKEIPSIKDAVHLYDGTPKIRPADNQMVTFMSPNYGWLKAMLKHEGNMKLYLPFWTLDELLEANEDLKRSLTDEEIERRYNFFGGSARMCLKVNLDAVLDDEESLRAAIAEIDSFDKVKSYLKRDPQKQEISHKIFFYVPELSPYTNLPKFAKFVFCSDQVARLVEENIKEKTDENRQYLVDWLKGNSECSSLLAWLFEGYFKETLYKGGNFSLVSLSDQYFTSTPTTSIELTIPTNTYIHAEKRNYESIDGSDIIKHLQSMKLVGVSGLKVYLVFVVPKGMNDFKKQEVEMQDILAEHCSVNELPGIGPKGAEKLKSKGIITVKQLQHAVETDQTLQSYKKKLDTFREIESQKELLNGIHQYLLVTEGDYKRSYVRYTL